MDKISKLSQAIRLGATFKEQCVGDNTIGKSCALRAAQEAIGITHGELNYDGIAKRFGVPRSLIGECWINNDNGWTREQIADWLEAQGL